MPWFQSCLEFNMKFNISHGCHIPFYLNDGCCSWLALNHSSYTFNSFRQATEIFFKIAGIPGYFQFCVHRFSVRCFIWCWQTIHRILIICYNVSFLKRWNLFIPMCPAVLLSCSVIFHWTSSSTRKTPSWPSTSRMYLFRRSLFTIMMKQRSQA